MCGRCLGLAGQCQRVLHGAVYAVFLGHVFGGDTHVVLVVDVPQAVHDHGVHHLPVTHALAVARAVEHVRRSAHVFLSTGNHNFAVARGHRLRSQHDGFETRAANSVDGQAGNSVRETGLDDRLARRVLADTSGQHLTHDDFTDLLSIQARTLQHGLDNSSAQLGGRRLGQRSTKLSDSGTGC